ncbi:MAG: hypothetical protein IIU50_00010, partial [Bacteroidaceae bacterium]|nr:hypothetical protein [Bacteroidaceae bacterium]
MFEKTKTFLKKVQTFFSRGVAKFSQSLDFFPQNFAVFFTEKAFLCPKPPQNAQKVFYFSLNFRKSN